MKHKTEDYVCKNLLEEYDEILKENRFVMLSINSKFNAYTIVLDDNSKKFMNTFCISIKETNNMYLFISLMGIMFAISIKIYIKISDKCI